MIKARGMIIHLNGQFLEDHEARVSVFDRGFLFGDGVYESIRYFNGKPVMMQAHIDRLRRSMELIGITNFEQDDLGQLSEQLIRENGLADAGVYWQITRGSEMIRSHVPGDDLGKPTVFGYAWELPSLDTIASEIDETACILHQDDRWARCDIKSLNLLPNILAQMEAGRGGAGEAVLYRDGFITEGTSSNVWMWDGRNWITPPLTCSTSQCREYNILAGVTRLLILNLPDISTMVRPIGVDEINQAEEIILTSSTKLLRVVTCLDGKVVGHGCIGERARELHRRMIDGLRGML